MRMAMRLIVTAAILVVAQCSSHAAKHHPIVPAFKADKPTTVTWDQLKGRCRKGASRAESDQPSSLTDSLTPCHGHQDTCVQLCVLLMLLL